MKAAYERGCNFFDNAEVYAEGKAEITMGKCIQRMFSELKVKRSDLVISTKIFWAGSGPNDQGLSRKHIIEGTDGCLKRLQLDYVDVLFCHRPDINTPIEETVRAMNHVINQGKAFYWGTSEWSAQEITEADNIAKRLGLIGPIVEQPQYNMLVREKLESEYLPLFRQIGTGTTIWSPLASGLLTGKYTSDPSKWPAGSRLNIDNAFIKVIREQIVSGQKVGPFGEYFDAITAKVDKLRPIAEKLECTLAQLSLAWCLKNENVSTVITGASRPEQVIENFKALEIAPKLTPEILQEIDEILGNKPAGPTSFRRNV
jgi:voltage-dependent potassium channel beta subunit